MAIFWKCPSLQWGGVRKQTSSRLSLFVLCRGCCPVCPLERLRVRSPGPAGFLRSVFVLVSKPCETTVFFFFFAFLSGSMCSTPLSLSRPRPLSNSLSLSPSPSLSPFPSLAPSLAPWGSGKTVVVERHGQYVVMTVSRAHSPRTSQHTHTRTHTLFSLSSPDSNADPTHTAEGTWLLRLPAATSLRRPAPPRSPRPRLATG